MTKIIWLSDLHFTARGEVLGHDPRIRLQATIDQINRHHTDAAFCVISGDMVNRGTIEDYTALSEYLDQIAVPVLPMVGNHDSRSILRDTLSLPDDVMAEFVQYAVPTQDGVMLCLDTQKTGEDAGAFCATRLQWLKEALAGAEGNPVYLFMHHPSHTLGLPMQDADNLEDGDAFLDLVTSFDSVKYLFIGHVHRPISGTIRGLPFSTMRSVLYQAPAPQPSWTWETFKPTQEAPNIGVIRFNAGDVTLHYDTVCPYELGGAQGN